MRRDLTIRPVAPSHAALSISFTYPDPSKARWVVRTLVTKFTEQNVEERTRAEESVDPKAIEIARYKLGGNLLVLDPASLPQEPHTPNRLSIALAGFGAGFLLGAVTLHFRRHTLSQGNAGGLAASSFTPSK